MLIKSKKYWLRVVAFLLAGAFLFWGIQEILTPNWRYPKMAEGPEDMIREFDSLLDKDEIQAVFIGTSHCEYGVDPMQIYCDTGVATFNLSSSNQQIETSYLMLERAFSKISPKYVFFDVSKLFEDVNDYFNDPSFRFLLDSLPFDEIKLQFAKTYAKHFPRKKRPGAFLSAFFPIYAFHDRWTELTKADFTKAERRNFYRKGYYLTTPIWKAPVSTDLMNKTAEANFSNLGWEQSYSAGQSTFVDNIQQKTPLYRAKIQESALKVMLRMKDLCEANGAKLILFKVPSVHWPQYYNAWTVLRSKAAKDIADAHGLRFLDFLYDRDCKLNWQTDTLDAGRHMNWLGKQKISTVMGRYLQEELGCTPCSSQDYEEDMPIYQAMSHLADLKSTVKLIPYLEELKTWENITVFFSVSDDMTSNLSMESRQALNAFGLQTNFDKLSYSDSFLAVVEQGIVKEEVSSNRLITRTSVLKSGQTYTVTSCGWNLGAKSTIDIDGINYSLGKRGLNIVVLDNTSGLVLDSVTFDSYAVHQQATRNFTGDKYLREYEEYLMRKDAKNGVGC